MKRVSTISSILGSLTVASATMLSSTNPAQAAALVGRVFVNPVVGGGVEFIGSNLLAPPAPTTPTGAPLTGFNFLPAVGDGTAPIIQLNASSSSTPPVPCPAGSNFCPYVGGTGNIKSLGIADLIGLNPTSPINDFIVVNKDGSVGGGTGTAFTFDLLNLAFPSYSESMLPDGTMSTTVALAFEGIFTHVGDGSNDISHGIANVSADFEGLTIAQTINLFNEEGKNFGPINYSISIRAAEKVQVPESSNVIGLLAFGLVGSCFILRKGQKQIEQV